MPINKYPNAPAASSGGTQKLWASTADLTIANTIGVTSIFGTGVGSLTLAANALSVGSVIRIRAYGYIQGTSSPSVQITGKVGGSTVTDTGTMTSLISALASINVMIEMTCRAVGVSGTIIGQTYAISKGSLTDGSQTNTTTTINTTGTLALDATWKWGAASASNTVTFTNVFVEQL